MPFRRTRIRSMHCDTCGVDQARRAWLTVLNKRPLAELRKVLKRNTSPKLTHIKATGGVRLEKELLKTKA